MLTDRAQHDGTLVKTQHSYTFNPPREVKLGTWPGTDSPVYFRIVRVGVFLNTWNGDPRPTNITATTDTGRTLAASTGRTGVNDTPELLEAFADLIADAEQRQKPQTSEPSHGGYLPRIAIDGEPVPHRGTTRDEQPTHPLHPALQAVNAAMNQAVTDALQYERPATVTPHLCSHPAAKVHVCDCTAGADHGSIVCPFPTNARA